MIPHTLSFRSLILFTALCAAGPFASAEPTTSKTDKEAAVSNKDVPSALRTPIIDRRLERLRQLIVKGIGDGQITPGEASSLHNDLKRIERREDAIKGDEKVTRRERHALHREINELHEQIWKKTHNGAKPDKPLVE